MTIANTENADGLNSPPAMPSEPAQNEDAALALLNNGDLSSEEIEAIAKSAALASRKVRLAMAAHSHTPRRIALRLVREFYTFDLMHFSQMPSAPADLRRLADEALLARLASITLGERISLARRSSPKVVAALLTDKDPAVWQPALENPRLTEAAIVKALQRGATPAFVEAVCHHAKWSLRAEIRVALLRNAHTPLARALEFARRIPPAHLRDILHNSRLPEKVKVYLRRALESGL